MDGDRIAATDPAINKLVGRFIGQLHGEQFSRCGAAAELHALLGASEIKPAAEVIDCNTQPINGAAGIVVGIIGRFARTPAKRAGCFTGDRGLRHGAGKHIVECPAMQPQRLNRLRG